MSAGQQVQQILVNAKVIQHMTLALIHTNEDRCRKKSGQPMTNQRLRLYSSPAINPLSGAGQNHTIMTAPCRYRVTRRSATENNPNKM